MKNIVSNEILETARKLGSNYQEQKLFDVAIGERLPSRDVINSIVDELRDISFPGFFGKENMGYVTKENFAGNKLSLIYDKLFRQVKIALSYGNREHSYEQIKKKKRRPGASHSFEQWPISRKC